MRTTQAVIVLLLAMSVGATVATAQVATEERVQTTQQQQQQFDDSEEEVVMVVTIQDLTLTEDQENRIAGIRKEWGPKVQEAAKELKTLVAEEIDKIRNALTPEQRQKIQSMIAERKEFREESLAQAIMGLKELDLTDAELAKIEEIRKEYRPRTREIVKQLEGLLSDAQKKARKEALAAGKTRKEVLQSLNLTSEQVSKLETVGKELKQLVSAEVEKLRGVLTAGQKETLKELAGERREMVRDRLAQRIADFKELNLTDEQRTTLANIRQEYRPRIQEAGNQLRASLGEEVQRIATVLRPTGAVAERPLRVE